MPLVEVNIPSPRALRRGWAIAAAICAARDKERLNVYADSDYWYYDDGGGNWACLRFRNKEQAVLFGHDHEYSRTYFRDAARDFGEQETDLLRDAPEWWIDNIDPPEYAPYIGFIYGWEKNKWWRADYDENDGFKEVGLLRALSIIGRNSLSDSIVDVPESPCISGLWRSLKKYVSVVKVLRTLMASDADIMESEFEKLVLLDSQDGITSPAIYPVSDTNAAVAAAKRFLAIDLG